MNRVVLLNTSILTTHGVFAYTEMTTAAVRTVVQEAAQQNCLLSAIGHDSTAQLMTTLLGVAVPVNRIVYVQQQGDIAIVFKLNGRPPEGTILTEEEIEAIGYTWGEMRMLTEVRSGDARPSVWQVGEGV